MLARLRSTSGCSDLPSGRERFSRRHHSASSSVLERIRLTSARPAEIQRAESETTAGREAMLGRAIGRDGDVCSDRWRGKTPSTLPEIGFNKTNVTQRLPSLRGDGVANTLSQYRSNLLLSGILDYRDGLSIFFFLIDACEERSTSRDACWNADARSR